MQKEAITIRSYRVCFDLERRIFRLERWRIPLPWGLPVRSIAYGVAALLAVVVLARVPLVGQVLAVLPTPVRIVVLPVALSYLLTQLRIDGRPAHSALVAWVRWKLEPSRIAAFRPIERLGTVVRLGEVTLLPDERSGRYRRARIEGPAQVLLRYPARARRRGATLEISQAAKRPMWRGKVVGVGARQRIVIR